MELKTSNIFIKISFSHDHCSPKCFYFCPLCFDQHFPPMNRSGKYLHPQVISCILLSYCASFRPLLPSFHPSPFYLSTCLSSSTFLLSCFPPLCVFVPSFLWKNWIKKCKNGSVWIAAMNTSPLIRQKVKVDYVFFCQSFCLFEFVKATLCFLTLWLANSQEVNISKKQRSSRLLSYHIIVQLPDLCCYI